MVSYSIETQNKYDYYFFPYSIKNQGSYLGIYITFTPIKWSKQKKSPSLHGLEKKQTQKPVE